MLHNDLHVIINIFHFSIKHVCMTYVIFQLSVFGNLNILDLASRYVLNLHLKSGLSHSNQDKVPCVLNFFLVLLLALK